MSSWRRWRAGSGSWRLLLIIQGADGDADASDSLAKGLLDHFTVLTYDRRGLARSPIADPGAPVDLTVHADDAAELLRTVTDQPAFVFGTSIGALIGLELVVRHPDRVRRLVAHEPPAGDLLPEPRRTELAEAQLAVEQAHRTEGVPGAMRRFLLLSGFDRNDREPDLDLPAPKPERAANLEFFLTHDAPAVRRHQLDLNALKNVAHLISPAAGSASEGYLPHQCAQRLAEHLNRPLELFCGGHSGAILRPKEFAEQLREILLNAE